MKAPQIKKYAEMLLLSCFSILLLYLVYVAAYFCISTNALKLIYVFKMLDSSFLALLIATAGGILLDLEIRLDELKK